MATLRQIRSVLAVYEEGSFTAAAVRENATQSGVSQHVAAVEAALGVALFVRGSDGVRPTPAGTRYYASAIEGLNRLAAAESAAQSRDTLSGPLNAGLMPTFTRAVLAPGLERMAEDHPNVSVRIFEGYSGTLTDMVRAGELDFACVPAFAPDAALTLTPLTRDREMLVARPGRYQNGVPVPVRSLEGLKLIVPTIANTRRPKLETFLAANAVHVARVIEMDSMMGTLDLVARSDWVAILPSLLLGPDREGTVRSISPLCDPAHYADFVTIEPTRRPLSPQASAFLAILSEEIAAQAEP
ncbi:MAG: LysR family transcriptional regulator [Pseudomonadota bacterium]